MGNLLKRPPSGVGPVDKLLLLNRERRHDGPRIWPDPCRDTTSLRWYESSYSPLVGDLSVRNIPDFVRVPTYPDSDPYQYADNQPGQENDQNNSMRRLSRSMGNRIHICTVRTRVFVCYKAPAACNNRCASTFAVNGSLSFPLRERGNGGQSPILCSILTIVSTVRHVVWAIRYDNSSNSPHTRIVHPLLHDVNRKQVTVPY